MKLFSRFLGTRTFYQLLGQCMPWTMLGAVIFLSIGVVKGVFLVPPDYLQGEGFRILYVHVPAAIFSLAVYTVMFFCSCLYLVWKLKIADMIALASSAIGASFALIALITGAIWGKPMWGTYWVWDARVVSEVILLFFYLGYLGLRGAIPNPLVAARASAILAIVGMVDVPIVHFSVEWWTTLHQGSSLNVLRPKIAPVMLYPLLSMLTGFGLFYLAVLCIRVRTEILKRERHTRWVKMHQF